MEANTEKDLLDEDGQQLKLYNENFQNTFKRIDDNSIDLVITDPPYPQEYDWVWKPLGELSSEKLKVGGSFVSLFGHYQLPKVIDELRKSLRFWWICGMGHGNLNRLPGKWVCVNWKPAVWFVNERRKKNDTEAPLDFIKGGSNDEWEDSEHKKDWGQPISWFEHYIERLTDKGDIVFDPFMGTGTVGRACQDLNRKFIGCDNDKETFNNAKNRLGDTND